MCDEREPDVVMEMFAKTYSVGATSEWLWFVRLM